MQQLSKAWDKAVLIKELEKHGIALAEPAAEALLETVCDWANQSLVLEGGIKAAVALPLLNLAKPLIKQQIDKINPEDGDGK